MAIAVTAVLAIVAVKNDVDFLSTLALALAVLAFVIQIIVFIAQSAAAGQQLARAEELHGSTLRALAAIEEKAEGTRQTVNVINDRVLGVALGKVLPDAEAAGVPLASPQVTRRIAAIVNSQEADGAERPPGLAHRRAPGAAHSSAAQLPLPSSREIDDLMELMRQLNDDDLYEMDRLGEDFERFGNATGRSIGHGVAYMNAKRAQKLHGLKLIRKINPIWGNEPVYVLTDRGLQVSAALRSAQLPVELRTDELETIRERLKQELARTAELLAGGNDDLPVETATADS